MAARTKKLTANQQAEEDCKAEIQAALDKHGCELKASVTICGNSTQTQIAVVSKATEPKTGK